MNKKKHCVIKICICISKNKDYFLCYIEGIIIFNRLSFSIISENTILPLFA